ncbi:type II secretion system protein [Weizmannia sp. CD-2023]|uniref:type II secretion system protein n=1 Tax=Heyndrickxia TaxID=2837504 RepID=UPI002E2038E6|nr:type II secretion system protein [Weizmannia sp. CD-2023]
MSKNERGFTFPEVIAAFAVFCLMAACLFPPFLHMLGQIKEAKQEMEAARFLYEKTQEWTFTGKVVEKEKKVGGATWTFQIKDNGRKACVKHEQNTTCVSLQQ